MLEIKNLTHEYTGSGDKTFRALDNISLKIANGEFAALIGHTGSGKSTLVQIIAGLLRPTAGEVFIDGVSLFADKKTLRRERSRVGMVFQYPEHQLFEETVYDDVAFGPKNLKLSDSEVDFRVREALRLVGVGEDCFKKSPFDMSGGQKRRVAIAGVLAMHPEVLILDEPTAGLDPQGAEEILSEIKSVHKSWCDTVILVSHSMEDVAATCDRVIALDHGTLYLDAPVKEAFSDRARLLGASLDTPQISRVAAALIEAGFDLPKDILTVKDARDAILARLKGGRA